MANPANLVRTVYMVIDERLMYGYEVLQLKKGAADKEVIILANIL